MYDCLFLNAHADAGGKDSIESLNPNSLKIVTAIVEPSLTNAKPDDNSSLSSRVTLRRQHGQRDGESGF
jgi:hypothetical protein